MISDAACARAAIRCLRAGIVPHSELDRLSVGYAPIRQITDRGLKSLLSGKRVKPLLVRGEWGAGKTHFLSYVRAECRDHCVASASVVLNARAAPLNHPQRFYPLVAETLRVGDQLGLKAVITTALRNANSRALVEKNLSGNELVGPLLPLLLTVRDEGFDAVAEHWAWTALLGADIAGMDYPYKRQQALARLEALGLLLRSTGHGGLVLLLDETETIDQLWNVRSRLAAYDVIGRLCQMRTLWCMFAVTARFDRTIELDLENGILANQPLSTHAQLFLRAWNSDLFDTVRLPEIDKASATQIARAVARIYEAGYGRCAEILSEECIREWSANPARNPRRLMRLLIHRFDLARDFGRPAICV